MTVAAIIAVALLGAVAVFQLALALGAPFGYAAWGGQHPGVLPRRLRIASGVAALVVYPIIILTVLDAAALIDADWLPGSGAEMMWVLTVLFVLGAVANGASRSARERFWSPVALATAACCAIIAAGI